MKRLDFIFFDAGGGHRSAATALQRVIEQQGRGWQIRLVNLQEVLDSVDIVRRVTGLRLQDTYNLLLRKGWTLGSAQLLRVLHAFIRLYHGSIARMLQDTWRDGQPDMVVSFVPHFNRALSESYQAAFPGRPFVTVLTDFADYPPHFWIERQEQFLICGTARAAQQARELGHSPERVFRTSGMILPPRFYEPISVDRRGERKRLGLEPDLPTGLVMFGGHGAAVIRRIVERLDRSNLATWPGSAGVPPAFVTLTIDDCRLPIEEKRSGLLPLLQSSIVNQQSSIQERAGRPRSQVQLIVICGKNERLAEGLKQRRWRLPIHVEGFTREVPTFMHLADFFIGKPGPGSISEALAMKLPVIVELNSWTLPQERYNVEWVREKGAGVVVPNFREITSAVHELLEPARFAQYRSHAAAIENRAVFEIPEILARILEGAEAQRGLPRV
jgi:1,2-diacylglycerol 3-beta-galactosyltransferase